MRKLVVFVLSVLLLAGCAAPSVKPAVSSAASASAPAATAASVAESLNQALALYITAEGGKTHFNTGQIMKSFDVFQVISKDSGREHKTYTASEVSEITDALSKAELTRLDTSTTPEGPDYIWNYQAYTSTGGKLSGDSVTIIAYTETQLDVFVIKGANPTVRLTFSVSPEVGKQLRELASKF